MSQNRKLRVMDCHFFVDWLTIQKSYDLPQVTNESFSDSKPQREALLLTAAPVLPSVAFSRYLAGGGNGGSSNVPQKSVKQPSCACCCRG